MKILLAIALLSTVSAVSSYSNYSETNIIIEENVTALRLTKTGGEGPVNVYFYTKDCVNTFLQVHPNYVRNGKESVPSQSVFICL